MEMSPFSLSCIKDRQGQIHNGIRISHFESTGMSNMCSKARGQEVQCQVSGHVQLVPHLPGRSHQVSHKSMCGSEFSSFQDKDAPDIILSTVLQEGEEQATLH